MRKEEGASLILSIMIVLSIALTISVGLSSLSFYSVINTSHRIKSAQSYYAAEAGIEDSILRLQRGMQTPSINTLNTATSTVSITISDAVGGARTIIASGETDNKVRKLSALYIKSADKISFYYGAQAGEGGVEMANNSQVSGNVFSNGSIIGTGEITDTAIISLNGNEINGITVGGDTYTYSCINSNITGTLYYIEGGTIENCDYGSSESLGSEEIASVNLPVSEEQINEWKATATAGGIYTGNYVIEDEETELGPIKINGDLTIDNNGILTITGLIYVTGNIITGNNAILQLDESYRTLSGIVIADGKVNIYNNAVFQGSGSEGSYIMIISTNDSSDPASPAIDVVNNAEAAIFYTTQGAIHLHNNINIKEATGYKIILDNNAVISYDSGLENANFTSGPSGGWEVRNWGEIE